MFYNKLFIEGLVFESRTLRIIECWILENSFNVLHYLLFVFFGSQFEEQSVRSCSVITFCIIMIATDGVQLAYALGCLV